MLKANPQFTQRLKNGERPVLIGTLIGSWSCGRDDTQANWAANTGESNADYVSVTGQLSLTATTTSGYLISQIHDLSVIPISEGTFYADYLNPSASTSINYILYGSDTGAFAGEEVTIQDIKDGDTITVQKRYWKTKIIMATTNPLLTPIIYSINIAFPAISYKVCMSNVQIGDAIPLIKSISSLQKEINPVQRVTMGTDIEVTLEDKGLLISDIIKNNFILNSLFTLELAFPKDETCISVPFYKGWVCDYVYTPPKNLTSNAEIILKLKDVHSELKAIVPRYNTQGDVDPASNLVLEYDNIHLADVMYNLISQQCSMHISQVDKTSFDNVKSVKPGYVSRRKNVSPFTAIYNTAEVRTYLFQICRLLDCYIIPQEDSKFYCVPYNPGVTASSNWIEGQNFFLSTCSGNLTDGRITRCMVSYNWKGLGNAENDISSYNGAYLVIDADAENISTETTVPPRKILDEIITPWLGPNDATYNGRLLAYEIALRYVSRWSMGATLIEGVTPIAEYLVQVGDVVRVVSPHLLKYGYKGSVKKLRGKGFMVLSKNVDVVNAKISWKLLEAV